MLTAPWVTPARGGAGARVVPGGRASRSLLFSSGTGRGATGGPGHPSTELGLLSLRGCEGRCGGGAERTGPGPPKLPGCTTRPVTCRGGANRRSRDVSAQQLRGCGAARGLRAVRHGQAAGGVRAAGRRHGRAGHPAETGAAGRAGRVVPAGAASASPQFRSCPHLPRGAEACRRARRRGDTCGRGGARRRPRFGTARPLAPTGRGRGAAAAEELCGGAGGAGAAVAARARSPRQQRSERGEACRYGGGQSFACPRRSGRPPRTLWAARRERCRCQSALGWLFRRRSQTQWHIPNGVWVMAKYRYRVLFELKTRAVYSFWVAY